MATIKAIEARSVHQIQSGQVIVDLCSVAKELVENSVDAGATSIEVRFKNNGLDSIEVQDNGGGIAPENYENLALKHYTSKLSSYDDLSRLQTFGFRGEALSSLCALGDFHVITAQAHQAPKANRLEFETSGKLKKTQIVAGQKGTTVSVAGLFKKLPVRRRELEKNIKREYGKVLNLLHAYACIMTGVRFTVKNSTGKTKNVVVFSTKGNQTTKENIANVYGAKTLLALIPLDLELEFEPSAAPLHRTTGAGASAGESNTLAVRGHVSRPVFGEGRQTPDRQMFFVNSRPCGLPQIAKAFNEVYKSFNVSQSPFVFADFHMDTSAYDVNVSPDKRTVLLHDAGALIESLKTSLTQLFESADQTVPQSQVQTAKSRSLPLQRSISSMALSSDNDVARESDTARDTEAESSQPATQDKADNVTGSGPADAPSSSVKISSFSRDGPSSPIAHSSQAREQSPDEDNELFVPENTSPHIRKSALESSQGTEHEPDTQMSIDGPTPQSSATQEVHSPEETPNTIQNAFDRMRPRRAPAEMATITIGNRTVTSMVGSGPVRKRDADDFGVSGGSGSSSRKRRIHTPSRPSIFGKHMRGFVAPGARLEDSDDEGEEEVEEEEAEEAEEEEEYGEEEEEEEVGEEGQEQEESEQEQEEPEASQPAKHALGKASQATSDHESDRSYDAADDISEVDDAGTSPDPHTPTGKSMTDEEKKKHEEAEVQRLIQEAEAKAAVPEESNINRANKMNKGAAHRDATVQLVTTIDGSISNIQSRAQKHQEHMRLFSAAPAAGSDEDAAATSHGTAEERLSLTVTKDDFANMQIIGQFNLGFILATRPSDPSQPGPSNSKDELFIIDQHASDEKFNFERLQSETIVQNQRLVQPKRLDLTAVEEEIVIENQSALEKNGFIVEVDDSGDEPIGRRCKLLSLPLSKEVVFGVRDLEELIVLLSETPAAGSSHSGSTSYVPRPTKVRKMFAMRACRSSIMIGKNLTEKQMVKVVRNMGTIDKPWNCPHGRPTMRHLMSLGQWDEWDEFGGGLEDGDQTPVDRLGIWRDYLGEMGQYSEEEVDEEDGDAMES
ncbi:putative DNA mismatch repair protein [Aspergillus campestris IBT 28561]|uniref:DNA mismatch repair protein PMS1 n=1 Tax=Aspergillus campestris (strain IBT 28561) TaxID=1392248 RepID=A0A2I1CVG7_ASPC2|nr:putative DNA mismatch repair protein [Aspergillus campestris IBT 28561]PKY01616.1 putative DNA mismatch repair protein [Aspergillus campestris IBT 28561]